MTKIQFQVTPYLNSSVAFRNWGKPISDALAYVGLTQVAATPIDWIGVSQPGSSNTVAGYEIWKFPDPPTGGSPLYMKLYYGTGVYSGNVSPQLWLAVGTGYSGSALTGPGSTIETPVFDRYDNASRWCWVCSDGDGLAFVHAYDYGTISLCAAGVIVIDRQRDLSGVAQPRSGWTGTGYQKSITGVNTFGFGQAHLIVDPVAGEYTTPTRWPIVTRPDLTNVKSMINTTGQTALFPMLISNRQGTYNAKMAIGYPLADIGTDTLITVPYLGGSHVYRTLGPSWSQFDGYATGGSGLAILWE